MEDDDVFIYMSVIYYINCFVGVKISVSLGYFIVDICFMDYVDKDVISFVGDSYMFGGDFVNDFDGDIGIGERVVYDEIFVDVELMVKFMDFVFEQFVQGFDEFEVLVVYYVGGEIVDVVVGFDGGGGIFEVEGFDDVGVEGVLEEVFDFVGVGGVFGGFFDFDGFFFEEVDEGVVDDFVFGFGFGEVFEVVEEEVGVVDDGEVDVEVFFECFFYLLVFVKMYDIVVDEDGVEFVIYVMCQWIVQVNFEN